MEVEVEEVGGGMEVEVEVGEGWKLRWKGGGMKVK